MFRTRSLSIVFVAALAAVACSKRVLVEVPPRVDLHAFEAIGIVEFDSEAKGKLSAFATQRFIEAVQESQPGVRVLELGRASDVKRAIGHDQFDYAAMQAIGEKYRVDAVVVGDLLVKDVRPNIDVINMITSMSVSADVDAALTARLLDTARGATVWTRSTRETRTVAQVGVGGGQVRFDAQDPEQAYGELVDALVNDVTHDFRASYVRQ